MKHVSRQMKSLGSAGKQTTQSASAKHAQTTTTLDFEDSARTPRKQRPKSKNDSTGPSLRQSTLSAAAKSAARRRDKQRGLLGKPTSKTPKSSNRRASLTGGLLQRTGRTAGFGGGGPGDSDPPSDDSEQNREDDEDEDDEGNRGGTDDARPPRRAPYEHGHVRRELWSKELDEINAPELTDAEPEDILEFQILYEEYTDKISNVAQKHKRPRQKI